MGFLATSHGKLPYDGLGGVVKCHTAKGSLQRPLNNQILDYESMLTLCQEEMPLINFYGISKETMTGVRRNLQKWFTEGKTIPGTRISHHFTPLSPSQIEHMSTHW